MILSGRLAPGRYVRLEPLAAEFGISVTPIREAMMMLREQGFVDLHPHRGFIVHPFSLSDLEDLFLVQALIGSELIARAAARIEDVTLEKLEELLQTQTASAKEGDGARFERLNDEFHTTINDAAASPRLAWQYNAALPVPRYLSTVHGWMRMSLRDHRKIIVALRAHDIDASRSLIGEHGRHSGDLLIRHLEKNRLSGDGAEWPEPASVVIR
jgi:DNA-binding GntR family transcriptional regulator